MDAPRTPEPQQQTTPDVPAAPRQRFRLKRKSAPLTLAQPTNDFLASVASADIAIPSIETPHTPACEFQQAQQVTDTLLTLPEVSEERRGRAFALPNTPAPGSAPSLSPSRYPKWSIDSVISSGASSPELGSRPSTARSTWSNPSLFSGLSSYGGEEDPGYDLSPKAQEPAVFMFSTSEDDQRTKPAGPIDATTLRARKPQWTPAMTAHLWAMYELYLSDPRVTPIRFSKGGIPPEGVQLRVVRQAMRSWKGPKPMTKPARNQGQRSESSTPIAESQRPFLRWPHTKEGTKAQLRLMCKQKARGPEGSRFRYMSRTPTPYSGRPQQNTPPPSFGRLSVPFQTRDMTASLHMSTSEVLQPQGPLAQITRSAMAAASLRDANRGSFSAAEPSNEERRRLGSPFGPRSHGPSSGRWFGDVLLDHNVSERNMQTMPAQRPTLGSPVQLTRPGTQKRKGDTTQAYESRKRPSLGGHAWNLSSRGAADAESYFTAEAISAATATAPSNTILDGIFAPRARALTTSASMPRSALPLLDLFTPLPRLGSPFVPKNPSASVPNRMVLPGGDPFKADLLHDERRAAISVANDLSSKLAYIDQRLKDFNN